MQKIKRVLVLIIIFLVLIDIAQLTWIYTIYKEEQQQYDRSWTNALGDATAMYQRYHVIKNNNNNAATFYIISGDSSLRLQHDTTKKRIAFTAGKLALDSIEGGLGYSQLMQMQNRKKFNLQVFDSLFKRSLDIYRIRATYRLDTFSNPQQKARKPTAGAGNQLVPTRALYPYEHADFPNRTAVMLVNTYGEIMVYASYKSYPLHALKRSAWMVLGSLLLFILSNIALLYVVHTIRRQKKLNELKNDFISNMTHELRTPITIASSSIDSILNHHGLHDHDKVRSYLRSSREELIYLDQLVEKILNLTIEEKSDLELQYEQVDLLMLLAAIVQNHQLIANREVHFNIETAATAIHVQADKMHLANALNNLVDNAIKYSSEPARIFISCVQVENNISISIRDRGIGIPKAWLGELFKPFFRVPQGNLHNVKGFGLGLSYVKKVIEKHGGSITVESIVNEGSTFTIVLPIKPTHG
jgi:two-component system, OmpR family, phosphate regulon sensor histidine kinase PhoR